MSSKGNRQMKPEHMSTFSKLDSAALAVDTAEGAGEAGGAVAMSIPPIVTQCAGGAPRVASHRAGSAAYAVVHPRHRCSKALLTRQALLHAPPWRIGASQTVLALLRVGTFGASQRHGAHVML